MIIFEDLLDDIESSDVETDVSSVNDECAPDFSVFEYCMAVRLNYYTDKRSADDSFARILDLRKFRDTVKSVIDMYQFFDEYAVDTNVIVCDDDKPQIMEIIEPPLPVDFRMMGIYERSDTRNIGSRKPVAEVRVYFNPFETYPHHPFVRKFEKMLSGFNRAKSYFRESGCCVFTYNRPDNVDTMRSCPLIFDSTFTKYAATFGWSDVYSVMDIDKIYNAIVKNPQDEKITFNFRMKRTLDYMKKHFQEIVDGAAEPARQFGMTLVPGKWVMPPYEAVYLRTLDDALSWAAFTVIPDSGHAEIFEIEEMLYESLISRIPYRYFSLCEFAVLLRVVGKVTNEIGEQRKKTYGGKNFRAFRHHEYEDMGFRSEDGSVLTMNGKRPFEKIRRCEFIKYSLDGFNIAIGNKNGAVSRARLLPQYPASRFEPIINETMKEESTWKS